MSIIVQDLGLSHRACDRCYGQKLRCRREEGSEGCVRCARADVLCTSRPVRSRRRARTGGRQQAPGVPTSLQEHTTRTTIEQTGRHFSEDFNFSPTSLLSLPLDMCGHLGTSSLPFDMSLLGEGSQQGDEDFGPLQGPISNPNFSQQRPPSGNAEVPVLGQEQQSQHFETEKGPLISMPQLPSPHSTSPLSSSETQDDQSNQRLSLARNSAPKNVDQAAEAVQIAHKTSFVPPKGTPERDGTGHGLGQEQRGARDPGRPNEYESDSQDEPWTRSWIREVSDINMALHQHMLSILPVESRQDTVTKSSSCASDSGSIYRRPNEELAVDCTLKLSHQYSKLLERMISECEDCQDSGNPAASATVLDQPVQLLVLSGYMCLLEAYEKVLQNIKWAESRLQTDPDSVPMRLPSLAIGSFDLPASSSTASLVLICVIESTLTHMHALVQNLIKKANLGRGVTGGLSNETDKQNTMASEGLHGVAKATLQAINATEGSIMKLIQVVWKLSLEGRTF